ncbi:MAG TPA: AzlD domain-containing protein [Dongiaceae bacterium]|jgi:branched-subunit amino acid transport protein|nr:AzlD domain-containing protein [Dongiaceae bacterium]
MISSAAIWWSILGASLVTYASRGLGVLLSGRINTDGPLFRWVSAVAYALLAALIARLLVVPLGPLASTSLMIRLLSAALALAVYLLSRRNLMLGVAAGGAGLALLRIAGLG